VDHAPRTLYRRAWIALSCLFVALVLLVMATLRWGGYVLIGSDSLPAHADGAVVLQASLPSENARITGAVNLLQEGVVDKVLLSLPKEGFWGQSFPEMAHAYLEREYGADLGSRFGFCVTGPDVNSTEEEARAIMPCIEAQDWHSFIVVTSNFHSRRAGMIWRRVWKKSRFSARIWVDGVPDPSFRPNGWWYHRLYAKTWFFESSKLLWSIFFR
jgi:uncharacterized SAM-binding protein YcdF (DUF218 family)